MSAQRPGRPLVLTMLALVAALAYFGAVLGNGLDRLVATTPGVEQSVPQPFRANADLVGSRIAQSREDLPAAGAAARDALLAAPSDHRSAAQVGAVRLLSGNTGGARAAFRAAAKFGWRERVTQAYWFEAARASGDLTVAAERLDALLRIDPHFGATKLQVESLEQTATGRQALALRAAQRPVWSPFIFNSVEGLSDASLARRIDTVDRIADINGPLGCETVTHFTRHLIARNMGEAARSVWQKNCDLHIGPGANDVDFRQLLAGRSSGVFGWRKIPSGDVSMRAGTAQDGASAMLAENTGPTMQPILSQSLQLAPGRYRLAVDSPGVRSAALSLDCGQPVRPALSNEATVTVLAPCASQTLTLWLAPRSGEVILQGIAVEPVDAS